MRRLSFSYGSVVTQATANKHISRFGSARWAALGLCATLILLSACSLGSGSTGGGGASTTSTNTTTGVTKAALGSDIPGQLKAAQPQDVTYIFEQSDAKFGQGPKLGGGVETKTPDLTYLKWTGPQTEQVIDYANAVTYARLGGGTWVRVSTKIAHYYDLQDPKVLGTETVNGVATYHISGIAHNDNVAFPVDVWVRTDNLYPVQVWENLPLHSPGDYFLFIFTAYNTGAKVTVPAV